MPACQHASMPACLGAYGRGGRSFYVVGGYPHTKKVCPNHAERALNSQSHGARTENASASPACQHASMPACQHASMPACYPRHIALLPQAYRIATPGTLQYASAPSFDSEVYRVFPSIFTLLQYARHHMILIWHGSCLRWNLKTPSRCQPNTRLS